MRKICLLPVLIALIALLPTAACSMWKQPGKGWVGATGGEQLVRLYWDEVKAKNWAELERHIASSAAFTNPHGIFDRAGYLESVKKMQLTDYSLGDVSVHMNGSDMVVTYNITMKGTYDGQPLPAEAIHMMTVWQQVTKGWIVIAQAGALQEAK